jgi:excisionase family DNA binding protein
MREGDSMNKNVPIADKALLTLEEAAMYFNIGMNKIRELTADDHCPYVLWNGSKRLIKRETFKEYLYSLYSI